MIEYKVQYKIKVYISKYTNMLWSLKFVFDSVGIIGDGASSRNRTYDLRINSPSL